jgi:ABC-2 type transport system permease protein
MNAVIAGITLRQLLSRRRTILLVLLGLVMILVALAIRIGGNPANEQRVTAVLLSTMGVGTLMPLVALLFGTGAIGSELEDGTAVYLLAKPINRATTLLTKLLVAIVCSIPVTCIPIFLAGLLGAGGLGDGLVIGFTLAAIAGTAIYCAVFVALSLYTSRALIFGLGYVLVWEGLLAGLFAGTRTFSIRQQTLALADAITDVPRTVFHADLDLTTAIVVAVVIAVGATVLAIRRLRQIEIAGETA